tara:strand:- start:3171 stop:3386 length:216 start_codon:yes stop_codon:yes gene_type:complete
MRSYNPARSTYKVIAEQAEKLSQPDTPIKSSGLLTPNKQRKEKDRDVSSPVVRVASHFNIIRNKRNTLNGS